MTEDTLIIGICKQFDDGAQPHFERLMTSFDVKFVEYDSILKIIDSLLEGDIDLAGISGLAAYELGFSANTTYPKLEISAFLPRRDPTFILASKDGLDFLPRKSKIFVELELVRRQLKRYRSDFDLCNKSDLKFEKYTGGELVEKLNELCSDGKLDGYVLERSEWNSFGNKGRRHTLGMQIETSESRQRFIPPPLRGFSLLISRNGFPHSIFEEFTDEHSMTSYRIESKLLSELEKDELLGIHVFIRRLSTIMKSLDNEGGLTSAILEEKLDFIEKNDDAIKKSMQMIEIIMEKVDEKGQFTLSLEKKFLSTDDEYKTLKIFVNEWGKIIELPL